MDHVLKVRMRRSKKTEVPLKNSGQHLKDHNIGTELTSLWQSVAQSKAALRHIENRLEAGPGTGVLLESIMDPTKKKSRRKTQCTEGQQGGHTEVSSKKRGRSQQSPEKSSSRSPLRNSTQDNTVRNSVEFREPLASYREATPPPCPSSPPELYSLQSLPGSSYSSLPSNSNPVLGHLVYQRDNKDKQTDRDLDSTHSSALESMEVRYLNDQPALDSLRTNLSRPTALTREGIQRGSAPKAQLTQSMDSKELSTGSIRRGESTPSTSPGSASQRLENLRRHQPDDKLEKLKERIRKQRQHLDEAVEREKTCNYLEKPVMENGKGTSNMPIAKVRKVATAPPAPIYKGFNSTETKIRTPDGKIWKEEQFHNLSREMYKDLSRQFAESTKSHLQKEQRDLSKERRPHKPVRKVHKVGPASDLNAKPVISPASWREGQKLVKMVLGPVPRVTNEESQTANKQSQKASPHRLSSDARSESNRRVHPKSTAKKKDSELHSAAKTFCVPSSAVQETAPLPVSTDMLSADIQGILEDLQLVGKTGENDERARPRSRRGSSGRRGRRGGSGSRTRAPVSVWETTAASRGCRSVSPTNRSKTANTIEAGQKKRHYDADTVRQYIVQQQERRKRRQAEEKKALREEAEKRNQRLQELYRKQKEVAKTLAASSEVSVAPVQKRLQATFNKLLLEGAQLEQEAPQMRPMYQPSGESDKENKRLEQPESPSSSDRSLNYPPFSRNDLDYEASSTHPERLIPAAQPMTGCSNEHLLSQLLRLETAIAASEKHTQRPATAPNHPQTKMSRIEALKATATSLSNRIESEARKLAGEGLNYGLTTAVDVDTILAPRSSHTDGGDSHWTEMAINQSLVMENEDRALRVERVLSGQHSYNETGIPGRDIVNTFKGQKEKSSRVITNLTYPQTTSTHAPIRKLNSYTLESEGLADGMEMNERFDKRRQRKGYEATFKEDKCTDPHDNSLGSISEGPLSEESLTDGDSSPFHPTHVFSPIGHREAVQYSARKGNQRLSEFQKEAERFSAFNSVLVQQENPKPAWEEFNKGSPLSVINIFTKNLHGNVKVSDRSLERNSPSAHLLPSGNCVGDAEGYENDFVSTHSSGTSGQKKDFNTSSASSHFEELLRRATERHSGGNSSQSPQRSSGSTSGSSPHSKNSTKKRGKVSDQSDGTLVEDHGSSCSPASEALSSESRKRGSQRSSVQSQATVGEISGHSHQSSDMDKKMSPTGSPDHSSSLEANSFSVPFRSCSPERAKDNSSTTAYPAVAEDKATGELQYSPAVLQQRLAAELHYLESIEESVRQLGDIERLMGVSMAQHESASMAQMLKAKQQQHEQELYELKIRTEREALETKLQMEENRQRVAQAHVELQESLAATQKETLEGLQEATTKMMSQQAEAARYTADTARHIKEMTEMAHGQLTALKHPSIPSASSEEEEHSSHTRQQSTEKAHMESYVSSKPQSALNSFTETEQNRRPGPSGPEMNHIQKAPNVSPERREWMKKEAAEGRRRQRPSKDDMDRGEASTSIEDEVLTAANDSLCSDSIPSAVEQKEDTTSVATELSLKFDESVTEDEIEERSFRSLLPSEAHRRGTLDKKSRHHNESEEDVASPNSTSVSGVHSIFKSQDVNKAFSGGQDSFSQFTMEMVRQYMRDEEVRLQHQSSLLHLRQKALKEKTRTELAWLEHQKKKLRDKGEDDKMPPIRKKQRGLLMKLQQEQAEIKRLQEANKAARKERQLLLKQQEEIERMRSCTLKLKERLKCADTEAPSESSVPEVVLSNLRTADPEVRSPSPALSISGSETSSIMQKLKKMRSQTDEKFLTKREQQLMQRRRHAEELLQWKQRLDQEEAEVRRIEKKALAAWDEQTSKNKGDDISEGEKDISPSASQRKKDDTSEGDVSSAAESSIHTDVGLQQDESSELAKATSASEMASIQSSPRNYTDEFTSVSPSPSRQSDQTSTIKGRVSVSASPSDGSSKTRRQNYTSPMPNHEEKTDSPITKQTEPISDQSDIESRIRALKEELRKRKVTANQLKKEQKKRTKERLKAKEANLRKQLETYNDIIEKAKAELMTVSDSAPDTKSPVKDLVSGSERPSDKIPSDSSGSRNTSESERIPPEALFDKDVTALPDESRPTLVPTVFSGEGPPTVAPTPIQDSPECRTTGLKDCQSIDALLGPPSKEIPAPTNASGDEKIISEHGSEIQEELKSDTIQKSEYQSSECLLKLDKDNKMAAAAEPISHHSLSVNSVLDRQIDTKQTSKAEEAVKSPLLNKSVTADITTHPVASTLSIVHSSSEKETLLKDKETSRLLSDAYHDDFDSSVDSSPREGSPDSNPVAESSITQSEKGGQKNVPTWITTRDSQAEEVEEEIDEELSSGASDGSHQYKIILDVQDQVEATGRDGKDSVNSSPSPPPTSPKMSCVPVTDEMPGFNIGERVVVSGVQPGTLRFKGPTSFANGFWAGVELDKSEGSNNGTYDGVLYFTCAERHGIFAPPDRITRLTDKFEMYTDTTEDDDSFFDDMSDDERDKNKETTPKKLAENEQTSLKDVRPGNNKVVDAVVHLDKAKYKSQLQEQSKHPITNGKSIWDFEEVPRSGLTADTEEMGGSKESQTEVNNLVERADMDLNHQFVMSDVSHDIKKDDGLKDKLSSFADKLLTDFVKDTVQQFAEIKKSKVTKITAANQMNGNAFEEEAWISSVDQKDDLPFFLTQEKEERSSPELCNRPESPVLGASGQEELAKRLAELELSRELLDELGDDHDWFEEDFGLSSRREQQRQKQREEEEQAKLGGGILGKTGSTAGTVITGISSLGGEQQVKTPPRPELPLPLPPKLPEEPAMVVPHSATQVEKMVHAATLEIWETCGLGKEGSLTITQQQRPKPSHEYIGEEPHWEDQEAVCIYSYRKAVYDLTWEILQDMFAEDPNAKQPQWLKPQRVKSSSFQRVRTPGSLTRIQECITAEVLKLYGLTKDQSHKTDWQKMLKFGRKKRDRVDHILVQELHEEEAQWVNYDEDELFVKIQLADSIFDALLKDTANVLTEIYDKRDNFS